MTHGKLDKAIMVLIGPAVVSCWVLEAAMNMIFGFEQGGGEFPKAWLYAAAFVAVAIIAAWLPTRWPRGAWQNVWPQRVVLIFPIVICFVFSQMAGWRVIGTMLADGGVKRDAKADTLAGLRNELKRKQKALDELGSRPTPATIEAQIRAQLDTYVKGLKDTVGAATKDCKNASDAPAACKRVADLRIALAQANSADTLPAEIEALQKRIMAAPKIAQGTPDRQIAARLLSYVVTIDEDGVAFWYPVFVVLVIGGFANFGFALIGVGRQNADDDIEAGHLQDRHQHFEAREWGHLRPSLSQPIYLPPPSAPAPNIKVTLSSPPSTPYSPHDPQPVSPAPGRMPSQTPLGISAAPDVPVDRSHVQQDVDHFLTFAAACLVSHPNHMVALTEIYRRYKAWAGGNERARSYFEAVFPHVAGLNLLSVGGVPHVGGVALREPLKVVGA